MCSCAATDRSRNKILQNLEQICGLACRLPCATKTHQRRFRHLSCGRPTMPRLHSRALAPLDAHHTMNTWLLDLLPDVPSTGNDSKTSRCMQAQQEVHQATHSDEPRSTAYKCHDVDTFTVHPKVVAEISRQHFCGESFKKDRRTRIVTRTGESFDSAFHNCTALV